MNNPYVRTHLHGIKDAEGITPMPDRNFKHTTVNTLERLGDVGLATFCGNRAGWKHPVSDFFGKLFKVPPRSLDP
jgi:hypothetical protein